jgi:hypothetical protein
MSRMSRTRLAIAAALALPVVTAVADTPEPGCNRWDLEATCSTTVPRVAAGEPFSATITVRNAGDMPLVNVLLSLRGDLGARPLGESANPLQRVVERLEPGESQELSGQFVSDQVGIARVIGGTRDATGWSASGCACTVDVVGLPAIEASLVDRPLQEGGAAAGGTFYVNDTFRYVLTVADDGGSSQTPDLKAVFTLPKELEFVSGSGDKGITVTGEAQTAQTSAFVVAPKESVKVEIRVRVKGAPPSNFVQTRASVQTVTGIELAQLMESTTLR